MSRYYMGDEERRGYDARREEGRFASPPYSESYDYRQGWESAESDMRRERMREEERQQEEAQREADEERRRHEAYLEQQRQEEAYYEQMRQEEMAQLPEQPTDPKETQP